MSRETILDEAILKAKEAEDWQLAEWLRMARGSEKASRWYTRKLNEMEAEMAEMQGTIECLKGLAEANYERCDTCEAMLDCDECLRADASHKELRGLQAENNRLRELVRDMYAAFVHGRCYRWCEFKEPCNYISDGKCQWYDRMAELGMEVEE